MDRLQEIQAAVDAQSTPPVHLWKVDHVEPIDIHIDAQGQWFYLGTPFVRKRLEKLFSTVLWYENDTYYLVTPIEKLSIRVDDVPFIIEQAEQINEQWFVTTSMQEKLLISAEHPVELRQYTGVWLPYVKVRYNLWARVNRNVYYQWVSDALDGQALENNGSIEEELVGQGAAVLQLSSSSSEAVDYVFEVGKV